MKRILLIKITSMGDLIQMLPAITDAAQALPGIRFDWLAEESFQDIPTLHPAVNRVIPLAYRRWKKSLRQALWSGEPLAFLKQLRLQSYDRVIDMQSNIKSAVVTSLARGPKLGLDARSVREYGAHWAYDQRIHIDRQQNHTERLRQMLSTFLGYPLPTTPANYGIELDRLPKVELALPDNFIFLTAIASVTNKLWPENYWSELIAELLALGYSLVMPYWSQEEKQRITRLKNNHPQVFMLPPLDLHQKARVLSQAKAAISLDTGLSHMAAALNIPNICLYGPGDFRSCGTVGYRQIHLPAKSPSCAPCQSKHCDYQGPSPYQPACMASIHPGDVLAAFHRLFDEG